MEVRYQCTPTDYAEAQRAHAKKSAGYYVLLVLGILSVLVGLAIMLRVSVGSGSVVALGGICRGSRFVFLSGGSGVIFAGIQTLDCRTHSLPMATVWNCEAM